MSDSLIISTNGAIDRLLSESLETMRPSPHTSFFDSVKVVVNSFLDGTESERDFAIRFVAELIEREGEI